MATTTVTSSGSGIGKTYGAQPIMSVADSMFVFDLNDSCMEALKGIYGSTKFNNTTVLQLQKYNDPEIFERNLRELIQYGIFDNQDLCDKVFVITPNSTFTSIVNKVWPEEQRAITKFRGRKWPDNKFVKEFASMANGYGSVGQAPEKIDPSHIISWFWEFGYDERFPTETYPFDPITPDDIPLPLEDGVEIEGIPSEDAYSGSGDDSGGAVTYTITYTWKEEVTIFPIQESHAVPMNNLSTSFTVPQNTISVVVKKMVSAVVNAVIPEGGEDSGA